MNGATDDERRRRSSLPSPEDADDSPGGPMPFHIADRTLLGHNESEHSLMANLTDKASKQLGWEAGEDVVVKLYNDDRIIIEPATSEDL